MNGINFQSDIDAIIADYKERYLGSCANCFHNVAKDIKPLAAASKSQCTSCMRAQGGGRTFRMGAHDNFYKLKTESIDRLESSGLVTSADIDLFKVALAKLRLATV